MNSSEEVDDQQENEDVERSSARKSYDCIFCKRGFTSAQALGGHMNIHRKDRAKSNITPSSFINSSKIQEDYYASSIFYQPSSNYPMHYYSAAHGLQVQQTSYQTCFPASVSAAKPFSYSPYLNDQNRPSLYPFGENWQKGLQFDSWHTQDDDKNKNTHAIEEDGLDLELRLGQDR